MVCPPSLSLVYFLGTMGMKLFDWDTVVLRFVWKTGGTLALDMFRVRYPIRDD